MRSSSSSDFPIENSRDSTGSVPPGVELLDAYLADRCSESERSIVEQWARHKFGSVSFLDDLKKVDIKKSSAGWDPIKNWELLQGEMARKNISPVFSPARDSRSAKSTWVSRIPEGRIQLARSIVLGLLLVTAGWFGATTSFRINLSETYSTYTTSAGERSRIVLPDGSTVILSVASSLKVPSGFGNSSNRQLELTGEALFTVDHHSGKPFTVITNDGTVTVLGTTFLMKNYENDVPFTVAVQDGKVLVETVDKLSDGSNAKKVVSANQEISVINGQFSSIQIVDAGRFTFANGVLTLRDMPLKEAVHELNRWYNADIKFGDADLELKRIKGEFISGSITDLVEVIEWTFNMRVERNGKNLYLYEK